MRLPLVLVLLISMLPLFSTFAQQKFTISGYVEDAKTGEKLIGANVYDSKSKPIRGTTTNEYGFYSLTLPADSVVLTVSYVGYDAIKQPLLLTTNLQKNITLTESGVLREVVIKADKASEKIEERTQMSAVTIPMKQIQSLPAFMGEVDVIKALQLMPGVQSGTEGSSGLYVRGGSPDQNLILLDGVPVYNVSHLFGFFSVFDANAINSVDLIKGGYPARYGGRLSSVLDIRMKEGNMKRLGGAFSLGIISSKLSLEAPIIKDKTSFIVTARRTYIDVLARPLILAQTQGDTYGGYYFQDFSAKINHKFSRKDRLYLSAYTGNDNFYFRDKTAGDQLKGNIAWGNLTSVARWNHLFTDKLFSNTTLTYTRYKLRTETSFDEKDNNFDDFASGYFSTINDVAGKIDFDYLPSPKHYIKFGTSATYHDFRPGVQQIKSGALIDTSFSQGTNKAVELDAYIEDDMKLSEHFKTNVGLHLSGFAVGSTFYPSAQPRISARYLLGKNLSIKASYAYMMQFLHLLSSSSGLSLPTDIWVPATERVKPQQSQQIAAGFAYSLLTDYEVSVEGYYKKMKNLIEYKEGVSFLDGSTWEDLVTAGKGDAYGAEFLIQRKEGKVTGWIGYTLAWSARQFEELNFGKQYPFKYDARHDFVVVAIYRPNKNIELSSTWVYRTGNAVSISTTQYASASQTYFGTDAAIYYYNGRNGFRMPAYHRLDVGISFVKEKKHGERRWNIDIYNAYNRKNPFFLYRGQDEKDNFKPVIKQVSLFPILPSLSYSRTF